MKFALGSDLHLAFEGFEYLPVKCSDPDVNTLVLAGDIVEVELLKQKDSQRDRVVKYLQELNSNFSTVIYVMGNHEHYGNSFIHTAQNLRTQFARAELTNFVLLEQDTVEVEDAIFFGATMWTTFRNGNPNIMNICQNYMNDYTQIHVGKAAYGDTLYLTPETTAAVCRKTLVKLKTFSETVTDKKKVLVTHMAPCHLSLSEYYKTSQGNDAYYEDISEILLDSDIKVAVHGHIHEPVCYTVGDTYVVSNPRGYFGHEPQASTYEFEVVNV